MKETDVRALLETLYLHVAAMPWADEGFTRSATARGAAQDQIVQHTAKEIMKLNEESNEKTTN